MPAFDALAALFEYLGLEMRYGRFSTDDPASPDVIFASPASKEPSKASSEDFLRIPWLSPESARQEQPPIAMRRQWLERLDAKIHDLAFFEQVGRDQAPRWPDGTVYLIDKGKRPTSTLDTFAVRIEGRIQIRMLLKPNEDTLFVMRNERDRDPDIVTGRQLAAYMVQGQAIWALTPVA